MNKEMLSIPQEEKKEAYLKYYQEKLDALNAERTRISTILESLKSPQQSTTVPAAVRPATVRVSNSRKKLRVGLLQKTYEVFKNAKAPMTTRQACSIMAPFYGIKRETSKEFAHLVRSVSSLLSQYSKEGKDSPYTFECIKEGNRLYYATK